MTENSGETTPEEQLATIATELGEAIYAAIPDWVSNCVTSRYLAWDYAATLSDELTQFVTEAGQAAQADAGAQVKAVLALDIDEQQVPPLSLLRQAVRYPTAVLQQAGVPPVVRDEFAERNFPQDIYNLSPANFADISPALHELGMAWGAAKAFVHLQRRRGQ